MLGAQIKGFPVLLYEGEGQRSCKPEDGYWTFKFDTRRMPVTIIH